MHSEELGIKMGFRAWIALDKEIGMTRCIGYDGGIALVKEVVATGCIGYDGIEMVEGLGWPF